MMMTMVMMVMIMMTMMMSMGEVDDNNGLSTTFPAGWVRSHDDMSAVHAVEVALAHCGSGSSVDLWEGDDDDNNDV